VLAIGLDGDRVELTLREWVNSGLMTSSSSSCWVRRRGASSTSATFASAGGSATEGWGMLESGIEQLAVGLAFWLLVSAMLAARSDESASASSASSRASTRGPREHQDRGLAQRAPAAVTWLVFRTIGLLSQRRRIAALLGGAEPRASSRTCKGTLGRPDRPRRGGRGLSGVSGTPTFFINGRRHRGAYDIDTLSRALRAAGARAKLASS